MDMGVLLVTDVKPVVDWYAVTKPASTVMKITNIRLRGYPNAHSLR